MQSVHASASGKIILFGEHAVVYGRPAIAVPVDQVRASVEVTPLDDGDGIRIEAADIGLSRPLHELPAGDPLAAAVRAALDALGIDHPPAMRIALSSTIPIASGLGSGAAVSIAILRGVSAYLGSPLTEEQVSRLAFEVEKLHHGTPSGIDNTVITSGCPVYFVKGSPIQTFRPGGSFHLLIADSGIPAPTKESVGDVRRLWEAEPQKWEGVFDRIRDLVQQAYRQLLDGNSPALGALMNGNHELLQELTVSCPALDRMVAAAREAGALGAKLSGGGRGGNCIALVAPEDLHKVSTALQSAGAVRVLPTTLE